MDTISCSNCDKKFATRQNLQYHLKKNVCKKIHCEQCKKYFRNQKSYRQHIKKKQCIPEKKIKAVVAIRPDWKIRTCEEIIQYDQIKLPEVCANTPDFNEIIFHVPCVDMMINLVKIIYCNDAYPEYWSLNVTNKSSKIINMYHNDNWEIVPQDTFLPVFISWLNNLLNDFIDEYDVIDENMIERYKKRHSLIDQNRDNIVNKIALGIHCALYNHRKSIRIKMKANREKQKFTRSKAI